jgi:hypothetical protein
MTMNDWINKLNAFLQFNEQEILNNSGKISAEIAKIFVENEFENSILFKIKISKVILI